MSDASLRRPVQQPDHTVVGKRVALDDDACLTAAPDMTDLTRDKLSEAAPQRDRRHQQLAVVGLIGVAGQVVEQLGRIGHEVGPCGEQADVGIDVGGRAVVVARRDMQIPADLVFLLSHDQADLAMGLQLLDAVHHMDAGVLQPGGPLDVAALIEACFQLDQHRHLFTALSRLDQTIHDR